MELAHIYKESLALELLSTEMVGVMEKDDMYSIYLRGKVYLHLCTVQIGVTG